MPPTPADTRTDAVTSLSMELIRHARLLHVLKASIATWAPDGLEGAAIGLLMQLVKGGPRRQGELADTAMLDPSTVSRYVGQLVRRGLAERRPDPADGRAVQLVATDAGHEAAHRMIERRHELFRRILGDWSEDDLRCLTGYLARLNDDVDAHRPIFGRPPGATDPTRTSDAGTSGAPPEEN